MRKFKFVAKSQFLSKRLKGDYCLTALGKVPQGLQGSKLETLLLNNKQKYILLTCLVKQMEELEYDKRL